MFDFPSHFAYFHLDTIKPTNITASYKWLSGWQSVVDQFTTTTPAIPGARSHAAVYETSDSLYLFGGLSVDPQGWGMLISSCDSLINVR